MNISFVPTLHHISSCRLLSSIFNHLEVQKSFRRTESELFKSKVTEAISHVTPNPRLREMLEEFIDPLFHEIIEWITVFERSWYGYDTVLCAILERLPYCWQSDGTIDREKAARALVKNKDLRPINRFVFACTFCFFDDALDLWKILYKIEKAYLKHKSTLIVKHWVQWMESDSDKKWDLFIAWTLETPMWSHNVCIMRHALQTLSPGERSEYLMDALIGKEVNSEIMRFCIPMLTKEEQEEVFRENPVEIFKCVSSWPLRHIFYDVANCYWPHLTKETFCDILRMLLKLIKHRYCDFVDLLNILKNFWARSPKNFQNIAKDDSQLCKPIQFILDLDVAQPFPKEKYLESFLPDIPEDNNLPRPQVMVRRHRRRAVRRRYRNIQ